eukprot:Plantae.Rhodophyta-Rhodochaete_pulchella.ctg1501.p1 GENE.Plantae.Rhodophyta-Rhodochaete_pulchella.ctg1501~~Plantae.Rhodophyta-Rhodochaete_pulchella.ctg1501.p1  ORF type:complete len:392 (+),score=49.81 Plantae.Rhodophyta-Rhodochaete_pulchella.ctg1501:141-1178(+)
MNDVQAPQVPLRTQDNESTVYDDRLILIDDMPSVRRYSAAETEFCEALEQSSALSGSLATICVSSTERFLADFQVDMDCISFRPVAPTAMRKALEAAALAWVDRCPSREELDALAMTSNGDIRSALAALKLLCLSQPAREQSRPSKRRRKTPSAYVSGLGKDVPLEAVRAVSKVLYGKRDDDNGFKDSPESIFAASVTEPSTLISFMFQNYLDFFEDIEDAAGAAECLSDGNVLSRWRQDQTAFRDLAECGVGCVASRGLMVLNRHRTPNSFRPIKGPEMRTVWTMAEKCIEQRRAHRSGTPDLRRKILSEEASLFQGLVSRVQDVDGIEPVELDTDQIKDWDDP